MSMYIVGALWKYIKVNLTYGLGGRYMVASYWNYDLGSLDVMVSHQQLAS